MALRIGTLIAVVTFALAQTAHPCTPLPLLERGAIDAAEKRVDKRNPRRPLVALESVFRNEGLVSVVGCDDPSARFVILRASDDRTSSTALSFTWTIVGGTHVPKFKRASPLLGVLPGEEGIIEIEWTETGRELPVDFLIEFVAVDRAGNRSRPSRTVRVHHPGKAPE